MMFSDLVAIADDIKCPPYQFRVGTIKIDERVWFVQALLQRPDTTTGVVGWGEGGKLLIEPHMKIDEIVRKFFVAARDYSEHEVREAFEYQGKKILGPHIGIATLLEAIDD